MWIHVLYGLFFCTGRPLACSNCSFDRWHAFWSILSKRNWNKERLFQKVLRQDCLVCFGTMRGNSGDLFFPSLSFVDAAFLPYLAIFMLPAFHNSFPLVNCSSSPIFFLSFLLCPTNWLLICPFLSVNSHYLIQIQFVSISSPPPPTCSTSFYEFRNFFQFFLCTLW